MTAKLPTAGDMMTRRVIAFSPATPLDDALHLLIRRGFSGAPVVDADGKVVGIFSEHDTIEALSQAAYGNDPTGSVGDSMSTELDALAVTDDLFTIARRFRDGRHRRLIVLDGDGRLVGLVSRRDLIRALDMLWQAPQRRIGTYELIDRARDA